MGDCELRRVAENERRDQMALVAEDELRAGLLVEVGDAAAGERKRRALQIRQVEGKGNAPLKPRLHGVAVGGDHFDRVAAGKVGDVQVGKLGE